MTIFIHHVHVGSRLKGQHIVCCVRAGGAPRLWHVSWQWAQTRHFQCAMHAEALIITYKHLCVSTQVFLAVCMWTARTSCSIGAASPTEAVQNMHAISHKTLIISNKRMESSNGAKASLHLSGSWRGHWADDLAVAHTDHHYDKRQHQSGASLAPALVLRWCLIGAKLAVTCLD